MKKIKLLEINDGGILRQDEMRNIHGGLSSGTGSGVGIYKCVCGDLKVDRISLVYTINKQMVLLEQQMQSQGNQNVIHL